MAGATLVLLPTILLFFLHNATLLREWIRREEPKDEKDRAAAFIQWSDYLDQLDAQIDSSTIFVVGLLNAFFTSGNSDKKYDCGD